MKEKTICVYASSSDALKKEYCDAAFALGQAMTRLNYDLVFGAGDVGLMGQCARGVKKGGGRVIGVIPEALNKPGIVYPQCDELFVTQTMRQRKQMMEERARGFIALPGGFGTLEEVLEILTLKQLRYHNKPIVLLNIRGFYDGLLEQFEHIMRENFAKEASRQLYTLASDPQEAVEMIERYVPPVIEEKWFTHVDENLRQQR
jgi:uncharacterized protein (TIGR00730 family)